MFMATLDDFRNTFAVRLAEAMAAKGVDEYFVAGGSQCSKYDIEKYLLGVMIPVFYRATLIAETLDVSLDYLTGRTARPNVSHSPSKKAASVPRR